MLASRVSALPRWSQPLKFTRSFSASPSLRLELAYDLHEPPKGSKAENAPIIFLHGLFGSKKNNRSMSKVFARELKRQVYAIVCPIVPSTRPETEQKQDLRNHGESHHDPRHEYTALAEDVEAFIKTHSLPPSVLIGHSMGAKAAMVVALRQRTPLSALISVDNAPVDAALKSDFGKYVKGMRAIEAANVTKQSEADAILADYEPSLPIRQFLLTNLVRDKETGIQRFRVPLKYLGSALDNMADFPFKDPDEARWEGPALFVRGTKSHYVSDETLPIIGRFFPRFQVADVDCGHWIISEKPEDFRRAVVGFLEEQEQID